eukprot:CAMPEP_0198736694 /NCGR_PEP_ID=MMETSP1475-20131203/67485_1 /TAXON_ID= ORGANISM="Unidentified sp., Strain CCMP1999" /NCGR_SAMPLE_ID=MMETSP1475 /ASSEMBLY_ACC=CAM_ASM_001111 /LENGTH=315 /DNA_ID=CAMNT_0044500543 /DNA_START=146 /DNA_END=1093 /DNA_ORIENTATION=+
MSAAGAAARSSWATRVGGAALAGATIASFVAYQSNTVFAEVVEQVDYGKVRGEIEKILDDNDMMGPTLVRLAWHASGTYDKESKTGGSDGATMRYRPESDHEANKGLNVARNALEPVKKKFPNMTYSDLWTLAGAFAIEYMGGPSIKWRPGRSDKDETYVTPDGRLPDADKGSLKGTIQHLRDIFYRQGFNDQEIVALSGAHALGRCYSSRSGYDGPWTRAPTTFSNEYFRELLENVWTLKRWDGPDQFEDPTGDLMMLPSDMALIWDKDFRKWVETYAKDEERWFKDFSAAFTKLEENGVAAFDKSGKKKGRFW